MDEQTPRQPPEVRSDGSIAWEDWKASMDEKGREQFEEAVAYWKAKLTTDETPDVRPSPPPASVEPRMVEIDVNLAVDLAWWLKHPHIDNDERAAMYASLVRYINASGQWHLTLDEELDE